MIEQADLGMELVTQNSVKSILEINWPHTQDVVAKTLISAGPHTF